MDSRSGRKYVKLETDVHSSLIFLTIESCMWIDLFTKPHKCSIGLMSCERSSHNIHHKSQECYSKHFWETWVRWYGALSCRTQQSSVNDVYIPTQLVAHKHITNLLQGALLTVEDHNLIRPAKQLNSKIISKQLEPRQNSSRIQLVMSRVQVKHCFCCRDANRVTPVVVLLQYSMKVK